jgi:hypothetical protein
LFDLHTLFVECYASITASAFLINSKHWSPERFGKRERNRLHALAVQHGCSWRNFQSFIEADCEFDFHIRDAFNLEPNAVKLVTEVLQSGKLDQTRFEV